MGAWALKQLEHGCIVPLGIVSHPRALRALGRANNTRGHDTTML